MKIGLGVECCCSPGPASRPQGDVAYGGGAYIKQCQNAPESEESNQRSAPWEHRTLWHWSLV